jgi:hypothetical protein
MPRKWRVDYGNIVVTTTNEYIARQEQAEGLTVIPVED